MSLRTPRSRRSWLQAYLLSTVMLLGCRRAQRDPTLETPSAHHAPEQTAEAPDVANIELRNGSDRWHVTRLARYRISARILSRERYYFGWQSVLSPLDLALGWGYMADPGVDTYIDWHQGGRWYFFSWSAGSPYQTADISEQSANVHIVPATLNLRRALLGLSRNQLIMLSGSLVRISDPVSDRTWQSSLSRTDHGGGACELMYVERLITDGYEYH